MGIHVCSCDNHSDGIDSSSMRWTPETLRAFEERVKTAFLDGRIKGPIHLSGGNEANLLRISRQVAPGDWVVSTWRSHYHALLKGVDPDWLFSEILAGRSMMVHSREHRFLSSSIVAGGLPIAVGLAMGLQRRGEPGRVWAFVGDMAARTGLYHEATEYAKGHGLPLTVVVEDNGLSTNTPTAGVWVDPLRRGKGYKKLSYSYQRVYPHTGVGKWVTFG